MRSVVRQTLVVVAAVLVVCGTPPSIWAADRCADGGRPRPDEGGIGGTGHLPGSEDDDSGIGGTGISAAGGTGIIGTITGFASICVGGVEVHYNASSRVEIDGRPSTIADLAVGQVVEVVAGRDAGGALHADDIAVRHIIAGPVTDVAPERDEIEVMGQPVRLSSSTVFGDASGERAATVADFAPGSLVAISGSRLPDGVVVASRATRTDETAARVTGPVASAEPGVIDVAGTRVSIEPGQGPSVGADVRVVGRWDGSRLIAASVEAIPSLPFDGRIEHVDVEGYASLAAPNTLRVGPYTFALSPAAADQATAQVAETPHIRIEAVVRGRQAIVERLAPAPVFPARPEPRGGTGRDAIDAGHRMMPDAPADPGMRDVPLGVMPPRPPERAGLGAPERPDRPDRPDRPAAPPERPPRIDRPPRPDRVQLPPRP